MSSPYALYQTVVVHLTTHQGDQDAAVQAAQQLLELSIKDKYNGWTNRETWAMYLYLGNEESYYKQWRDAALASTRTAVAKALSET